MIETRKNPQGTRVATFHKNSHLNHPPAHRYTVTLTKKSRTTEREINRHVRTQADARELSRDWIKGNI